MPQWEMALLILLAGAVASFINMMAGGGSMITLGTMILLGIEPTVANATNRVGIVVATGTGSLAFKSEKFSDLKTSLILAACAIPGAIIGAIYSVNISNELFQKLLAFVMIFILITLLIPQKKHKIEQAKKSALIYPAMFAIGFYGGFIQVGVGFLIMAAIRYLMSVDLLRVNMHKVLIVTIYNLPVLLVFVLSGKVEWFYALALSVGNAIGAWISVKLAIKKGEKVVKIVLILAIILMATKFLLDA